MFDIGWPELAVIAILAVIVIGPKDLPIVLRALGRWAGKARAMAREFRNGIEEMAKEAELDALRKTASGEADKPRLEPNAPEDAPGITPKDFSGDERR